MQAHTGKTQLSLPMFAELADENSATLTSSSADSHAKTSRKPDSVLVWKAHALVYGGNSTDLLARLDPVLSCWKMLQQLLMTDAAELKLLLRLPDWGTAQHGALYRLLMLERHTSANDGSVWATATADDIWNRTKPEEPHIRTTGILELVNATGRNSQVRLSQQVKYYQQKQDWHTPIANDALKAGAIEQKRENGLSAQVQWATPTVNMSKNNAPPSQWERNSLPLDVQVQVSREKVQPMNPAWVEMLMGFPPGWTELD